MTEDVIHHPSEEREKKPTPRKGIIFLLFMGFVVAGLGFAAVQMRGAAGPRVAETAPTPMSVSVMPVAFETDFELSESFSGLAEARRTSSLGFSGGGRIQSIRVDTGDRVKAGQVLAVLDTRALQAQLNSSQAVVEEARAAHALALTTVQRQETLRMKDHVSQQNVDEAQAQANTSWARVEAAKAQADTLRVQIDLARITAPYNGVVTARNFDEGAIAGPGQVVLEIVETGHLEARIGLPGSSAMRLNEGETYILESDVGSVDATLRTITGVIDKNRRTVLASFVIKDPGALPVGSVVKLSMDRSVPEGGVWLPTRALDAGSRGLWRVYVAERQDGEWRVHQRNVELVHSDGSRAFVRGDLREADRVVVDGLQRITPGMRVAPQETSLAKNSEYE